MGLFLLAGVIAPMLVCTGDVPAEPIQPTVQMVSGSVPPSTESPLVNYLPSVITFMERIPIFVEYFTTREVVFAFPGFLENYTVHITSSDQAVGSIGDDGWVDLTNTVPKNLSEGMFLNLTILDRFCNMFDTVSVEEASPAPRKEDSKGTKTDTKWNKEAQEGNLDTEGSTEDEDNSELDAEGMKLNRRIMMRLNALRREDVAPLAGNFYLIGHRFGKTTLSFELYRMVDGELELDAEMTAIAKDVDVLNMMIPTAFDMAFGIVSLVMTALVTGMLGCELEWDPVKKILKRPFGLAIGFCSQFIIMPLTAYVMCIIFDLSADHAIGIILAACSPGGGLSNLTSVAIDANLLLSISMTFFSIIVALGMMPLNLFIYSRRFQAHDSFPIPFIKIILALVMIVVPLAAGCLLRHFKKPWALVLIKLLKPVSLVVIVFALAGGIYTVRFVFTYIVPGMIVCSFSIPFIAFFLGGLAAFLCRQSITQVKTIAIETAIQNLNIGVGIVRLVYPSPDAEVTICAILWTFFGQSCLIFSVIGSYMFYKRILKGRFGIGRKKLEDADEINDSEGKRASVDQVEMLPLNEGGEEKQPL